MPTADRVRERLLDASTQVAIIATDLEGTISFFNSGAERLLGCRAAEAIGRKLPEFHVESELRRGGAKATPLDALTGAVKSGGVCEEDWTWMAMDGRAVPVHLSVTGVREETGELIGYCVVGCRLRETEEKAESALRLVVENAPAAISYISADGRYLFANRQHQELVGVAPEECVGRRVEELISAAAWGRWKQKADEALSGRWVTFEATETDPKGKERQAQVTLAPHVGRMGEVLGYFSLVVDVTDRREMESTLRQRELQSQLVFDNIPGLVSYVDAEQRYRFSNRAHNEWMGVERGDYIGRKMSEVLPRDFYEKILPHIETALGGHGVTFDNTWNMKSGRTGYLQVSFVPHVDEAGRVAGFFSLGTDITARCELEENLRASEAKVMAMIQTAAVGVLIVDQQGLITTANRKVEELFGYAEGELTGKPIEDLVPKRLEDAHRRHRAEYFASPRIRQMGMFPELTGRRKDGQEFLVDVALSYTISKDGPLAVAFVHDVTARKQQEARVRALAAKLLTAQEEERRIIARELHDDLTQKIAVIGMELGLIARAASQQCPALLEDIEGVQEKAHGLSEDVRMLSHELHPSALEHSGLVAALESHCAEFSRTTGIRAGMTVRGAVPPLSVPVRTALYRIAQEALRNAAKHSGASTVRITVTVEEEHIRVSVIDDGRGFDADIFADGGLGLVSMLERARLVSGTVDIYSLPGEGTRVEARVPLAASV